MFVNQFLCDMSSLAMLMFWNVIFLPLWLKSPSISMDDLEWAMQSIEQGTMPSWAGERSVVRTRHQSGLSWSRSRTSTVWPRRTDSSPLLPLLATKSWITTVNSQPPESCKGSTRRVRWGLFFTWNAWKPLHLRKTKILLGSTDFPGASSKWAGRLVWSHIQEIIKIPASYKHYQLSSDNSHRDAEKKAIIAL